MEKALSRRRLSESNRRLSDSHYFPTTSSSSSSSSSDYYGYSDYSKNTDLLGISVQSDYLQDKGMRRQQYVYKRDDFNQFSSSSSSSSAYSPINYHYTSYSDKNTDDKKLQDLIDRERGSERGSDRGSEDNSNLNYQRRLLLLNTANNTLLNPVVCLVVGASIIFDVSNTQYPVYLKDSLLNTNPDFDYSYFRELAALAATVVAVSSFAFTFTSAGKYDMIRCPSVRVCIVSFSFFSFCFCVSL